MEFMTQLMFMLGQAILYGLVMMVRAIAEAALEHAWKRQAPIQAT